MALLSDHRHDVGATDLVRSCHTERVDQLLHSGAQQHLVERHAEHELERHHSERDRPRALHTLQIRRQRHHRLRRRVHRAIVGRDRRVHQSEQYAHVVVYSRSDYCN